MTITNEDRVRVTPGVDTLFRVWVGDAVVLATDDMDEAGQRAREERWKLRPRHVRFADRCERIGRAMQRWGIGLFLIGFGLALCVALFPIGLVGLFFVAAGVGVIGGGK